MTFGVLTEIIIFSLGNIIKASSAVLIFGFRSMVALPMGHNDTDIPLFTRQPACIEYFLNSGS